MDSPHTIHSWFRELRRQKQGNFSFSFTRFIRDMSSIRQVRTVQLYSSHISQTETADLSRVAEESR